MLSMANKLDIIIIELLKYFKDVLADNIIALYLHDCYAFAIEQVCGNYPGV